MSLLYMIMNSNTPECVFDLVYHTTVEMFSLVYTTRMRYYYISNEADQMIDVLIMCIVV